MLWLQAAPLSSFLIFFIPSVEVTQMKTQCEILLEDYESSIENWYFKHQEESSLIKYLCEDRVLKGKQSQCLYEVLDDKKTKNEL